MKNSDFTFRPSEDKRKYPLCPAPVAPPKVFLNTFFSGKNFARGGDPVPFEILCAGRLGRA